MIGGRSVVLTLVALPLLIAGLVAAYVRVELAEPEPFADRAVAALRSEAVRTAIAEQVAVELLERDVPELVASRPVVLTAVEAIVETDRFATLVRAAAASAHALLLGGDEDVVVELERAGELLVPALEGVAPKLARRIPSDVRPRIAEIRGSAPATSLVRVADGASAAALPLLLAAAVALALAVALAPDGLRALLAAGLGVAAAAAVGLVALAVLRGQLVSQAEQVGVLSRDDARAAAGASWDAFAGGLRRWFVIAAGAGLAAVAGALLADVRFDRGAALRRAAQLVAGSGRPRAFVLLRGCALAAVGALLALGAEPVVATAVLVVGVVLVVLGVADVVSAAARRGERRGGPRRRRRWFAAAAAVLAVGIAAAAALIGRGGPPRPPEPDEITICNGMAALCDRRLDEVVLAGTHNSMAAAERPGWFFANQIRPIPRQLEDGIRLLMIDAHYGVVDSQGRVRTDLTAEGTDRNRVAARLGLDAVEAAERLAGRLGLVPAGGERDIFLCHTLCELGAERIGTTLDELRGLLERNPSEVVVVFVESSVAPRELEREVEDADLEPYLATLRRGEPLPKLRQMIAAGRRLVLLDQRDGGEAPWHHAGFVFVQDTRIDTLTSARAASRCAPRRGTPESPLLLMNHWIDRFPPPPSENRRVGDKRTLLRRVRSCRDRLGRRPTMIAVDFYGRGDLIATARSLNRQRVELASR